MFSFFKKKPAAEPTPEVAAAPTESELPPQAAPAESGGWFSRFRRSHDDAAPAPSEPAVVEPTQEAAPLEVAPEHTVTDWAVPTFTPKPAPVSPVAEAAPLPPITEDELTAAALASPTESALSHEAPTHEAPTHEAPTHEAPTHEAPAHAAPTYAAPVYEAAPFPEAPAPEITPATADHYPLSDDASLVLPAETTPKPSMGDRTGWFSRLKSGLQRTGSSITTVFTGTKLDDELYEDLEAALLMADAGVNATQFLLDDLKARVKAARATDPAQVRTLLVDAVADLLTPLQHPLVIGEHTPTVIMVAGVNGAGKTTSIGKLTKHLADSDQTVLLAAADTFRAAAREQLAVWADRNTVEIVSSAGGDPAALSYDAVAAGRARGRNVVLVDTAGRLPTQLHLMDELKKIRRTITKAYVTAPHEVLLVIDGNTGQNALNQVKAFDEALGLTGLIVTKLDGTAKGGVLCAIAREKPVPVYFIGVGERLEDLETFNAREFAQALLG